MRTSFAVFAGIAVLSSLAATAIAGCSSGSSLGESVGASDDAVTMKCGASAGSAVQGADVSVYQGNFSWGGRGLSFGYARISDGTGYVDGTFAGNWSNMKAAGVLRGAYQFFEPGEDEVAQANMMVAKVGHLGQGDLPAMIDVEATGGQSGATIAAKVRHWLQIVEAGTGRRPIIYTGSYFWQDNVGDTSFGAYPIWIAAYGPACPSLPPGWSNWLMWQYSDGGGSLDHDVFNGSIDELKKLAGASGPPTPAPTEPTGCGTMPAGTGLAPGHSFASCDGRLTLAMQTDGNLVLYLKGSIPLWSTGTYGTDGYAAVMQTDGNFVLYGKTSDALWASGTYGHGGAHLSVQDDGNLVVYQGGAAIWASGTNLPAVAPAPTGCGTIPAGHALAAGDTFSSCDGRYTLAMQGDGNLVLYHAGVGAIWATGTYGSVNGNVGYVAAMQTDGNFVLYDRHSPPRAMWASNTDGHAGADLIVQDDGNLVVYAPGGRPVWASRTNGR